MKVKEQLRKSIKYALQDGNPTIEGTGQRIDGRFVEITSVPFFGFFGLQRVKVDRGMEGSFTIFRPFRRLHAQENPARRYAQEIIHNELKPSD